MAKSAMLQVIIIITIVWHYFWICKAKFNQELFIITNFHLFSNCENVVKKGENLSAFLFSIYLNDLHDCLNSSNRHGLHTISEMLETMLIVFFKLFAILYADDTVLLAESSEELQKQLLK